LSLTEGSRMWDTTHSVTNRRQQHVKHYIQCH